MPKVTVIPSTINPITKNVVGTITKRRVAAYARVSTDSDEQLTSYDAQVEYYTKFIAQHPDWQFVKVYSDEGITGTNTKRREGFNTLIADALAGGIDLIITKSISRFARNTLDTIEYTRKLKAKGIEVHFEKEGIWSLDPKSEFILTICASIAQEESRSISQNVTMGKRWSMQAGKVSWGYKKFLGYVKTEKGIEIDEAQAETVRMIYRLFLQDGKTPSGIAKYLNTNKIPTPSGVSGCKWTKTTIDSILTNEKYKGDAILQKTYIVDYLEHRCKKNDGKVPSYYVEDSHPAIISKEEWEMVQAEIARRLRYGRSYSSTDTFASKLVCGDCGGFYGAKVWHSTDKWRKVVYRCNSKFKKDKPRCETPTLSEKTIKELFLKAYNLFMAESESLKERIQQMCADLSNTAELDEQLAGLESEMKNITDQASSLVKQNAMLAQDQTEYNRQYDGLVKKYEEAKSAYDKLTAIKKEGQAKRLRLMAFVSAMDACPLYLREWDEEVWNLFVESATVCRGGTIEFHFKNDSKIVVST